MKICSVFFRSFLIFLAGSQLACGKGNMPQQEPKPEVWVTDEQMPILSWKSVDLVNSSVKNYKELKDCGYTHSLATIWDAEDPKTTYNASLLELALNCAAETGIKVIAGCHELHTDTENIVKRFKDHPAIVGWFLKDEPKYHEIPGLGTLGKKIKALDDKNFVYVNLRPSDATLEQMGIGNYTTYLNAYIDQIPVDFLSFDKYPCQVDAQGKNYVLDYWYDNLQIFADASKRENKPFWAFACCTKFEKEQATPTLETLRLQMFTNLAYGAQGLQYYVYPGPSNPLYNSVKQLNKEIQNYAKVFLNAKTISIAHTGSNIPFNTKRFDKPPASFKKFLTGDAGAVVSLFEKENRKFLVVVSRDINNNLPVTIQVDSSVKKVTKNGTLEPVIGTVTEQVPPGDILVYTW